MLEALRNMDRGPGAPGGPSLNEIKQLITAEVEKLKEELLVILRDLMDKLSQKVDKDELWKSEHALLKKLDEVVEALLKKLADKGETKKALVFLEQKVKEIFMHIYYLIVFKFID
jgi:hypothetical protein